MKIQFLVIISALFLLLACGKGTPAKQYECTMYSAECELQKENILFFPITYDTNIVDVYGREISRNYQWYFSNKKSCTSVPIFVGGMQKMPTPSVLLQDWNAGGKTFRIDTIDISSRIPGVTKAAILLSGPNEIIPVTGTDGFYAGIAWAK